MEIPFPVHRLGILGGTFSPPHRSHIALASAAAQQAALDAVLLMPNGDPPHKAVAVSAAHRYEMVRLAAAAHPELFPCDMEMDEAGTRYTVETLQALHRCYPEAQLFFIVGSDVLPGLPGWYGAEEIFRLTRFLVLPRPGLFPTQLLVADARRCGADITLLDMPPSPISSTEAQQRIAAGLPAEELLGEAVESYIYTHGLYFPPEDSALYQSLSSALTPADLSSVMEEARQAVVLAARQGRDGLSARQQTMARHLP